MKTRNAVDKIVLSKDRDRCVVHMVEGPALFINFFKLGMVYFDGLDWIFEMLNQEPKDEKKAA
jgi:hypothetical protein